MMFNPSHYMISDVTVQAVRAETARAIQKHGRENTPLHKGMSRADKLVIMTEQMGEIAKAICEYNLELLSEEELQARLMRELLKLSASAAMFAESEDS